MNDVLSLHEIGPAQLALVGGKAANLVELSRIEGVRVPPGYCVTTDAFQRVVSGALHASDHWHALSRLVPDEHEAIRTHSAGVRAAIEGLVIPDAVREAIERAHAHLGPGEACAVRSSATAEDSPNTSFAGLQDTYLNVRGVDAILAHVRRCWASLFSERAVTYRLRNGIDHDGVHMAVVVQRMVDPYASGVMFTADPVSGHRKVIVIEAVLGLGESLVSGVANADAYSVRDARVIATSVAHKPVAVTASAAGGTVEQDVPAARRDEPALSKDQAVALAAIGQRIAAHFGRPQDVEWCLADDGFHVVQSRPITTLFPIPEVRDGGNHVWLSVGHQQMMTDPIKPLGLSFWNMTAARPMDVAGGRLFVDVTQMLASPTARAGLFGMAGKSDPLTGDALQVILDRGDFVPSVPDESPVPVPLRPSPPPLESDPAIVAALIEESRASLAAVTRDIATRTGSELLELIRADLATLQRLLFAPRSYQALMTGIEAAWWLNDKLQEWLGEKNAADTLTLSVTGNVTSEMGLALLEVSDVVRRHPAVVAFLERSHGVAFLDALPAVEGGREVRDAILGWLERYGMRGVGEIDITRPRWSERPDMLIPVILGNVRNLEPGAGTRRFEQGRRDAERKAEDVLARLRALPDGEEKARETRQRIDRVRTFAGYREYPKFAKVSRYFIYKQALLREAKRLVAAGVLREIDDMFYLTFDELEDMVRTQRANDERIAQRRAAFDSYRSLVPPRVLTSDGEGLSGSYRRGDVPAGALAGLPVSVGLVEGRARVVRHLEEARLEPGDILVTTFTDPSWTPLFVATKGLVTEVGGLMTHGAVIAREYGLPAVVGVDGATRRIRDGQRIRLNGTDGYVELLD